MTDAEKLSARAKALIADELVKEVFQRIEEALIFKWRTAADTGTRENSWHALKALELVQIEIQSIADNAAVTAFNKRLR